MGRGGKSRREGREARGGKKRGGEGKERRGREKRGGEGSEFLIFGLLKSMPDS